MLESLVGKIIKSICPSTDTIVIETTDGLVETVKDSDFGRYIEFHCNPSEISKVIGERIHRVHIDAHSVYLYVPTKQKINGTFTKYTWFSFEIYGVKTIEEILYSKNKQEVRITVKMNDGSIEIPVYYFGDDEWHLSQFASQISNEYEGFFSRCKLPEDPSVRLLLLTRTE
jgi:hypothetical protein